MKVAQTTVNINFQLIAETCINCGVIFGIPADFRDARIKDHR